MTAQEMFKELGYEKLQDKEKISYIAKSTPFSVYLIHFYLEKEQVLAEKQFINHLAYFGLSMEELNAINKQCEELGWRTKK